MASSFWRRHRNAQDRAARLNRDEMGVRTLEGPGSEERLRRLRRKFRKTGASPPASKVDKARLGLGLWLIGWATCVGIASAIVMWQFDPQRDLVANLQHIASVPNCAAARLVGAAPARVGEPGYWSGH